MAALKTIDLTSWDFSNVTDLGLMFEQDNALQNVDFPKNIDTAKVTNFDNMFDECKSMKTLDLSIFDMGSSTMNSAMLQNMTSLDTIIFSSKDNLNNSGLSSANRVEYDANGNPIADGLGGVVTGTTDGVTPVGTKKHDEELTEMYDAKTQNGSNTTWQINYNDRVSMVIEYVAEDNQDSPDGILYTTPKITNLVPGSYRSVETLDSLGISAPLYQTDFQPAMVKVPDTDGQVVRVLIPAKPVYKPVQLNITEQDSDGKNIKPTNIAIPVNDPTFGGKSIDDLLKNVSSDRELLPDLSYVEIIDPASSDEPKPTPLTSDILKEIEAAGYPNNTKSIAKYLLESTVTDEGLPDFLSNNTFVINAVYAPNKSNNSGGGDSSTPQPDRETRRVDQTISVHPDESSAQIYDDNGILLSDDALLSLSDWHNDEVMTLDGETYYRVATNKWIKTNTAYVYNYKLNDVRVYRDITSDVVDSRGNVIPTELAPTTEWKADRLVTLDNGTYYRIATDKFVSAANAYTYEDTSEIVHTNSLINLYDERVNELITKLPTDSEFKVDKVIQINGIKYYRVATNEFVKSTDDINII